MEEEQTPEKQDLVLDAEHEINLFDGKAENNPGVRKSSRPRKQSKRILDSAECEDDELAGIPLHKKHRKGLKLRTHRRKDILQNGRPFKCSLCESQYINNCPAKAKVKKELQPIVKEKFGQLLQLCVKCAIAVNHTENKGPTPEQRAEFEEEGKQFAQHLVKYLSDSSAARLYCSFYQTTKCGCIQCFITGTQANRRRKTSVSGGESETSDIVELKGEDGAASTDKADQTERAKYLLRLLKESMAKKQAQNSKTSNDKSQQTRSDNASIMKESETFILENRVKLKELGICERGCQKVLCYSNNFLHKKSFGSQPRLQRTKGRAALGRLHALEDLCKMRCCEKNCVKLAVKSQPTLADWRQRAQNGQKEMWKVLEEMLTFTDSGKTSCYKFICMVTGCCLTTVQKVYAEILLFRGTASCPSQKEHGMRFHWKRQKELGKLLKVQAMATAQDQPLQTETLMHSSAVISDTSYVPTLIVDKTLTSAHLPDVQREQKVPFVVMAHMAVSSQAEIGLPLGEKVADGKEDNKDIKEKLLQLFENIKDPKEIANMQQILAELQRDLKVKQEREQTQKVSASGICIPSSATAKTEPLSSSVCLASSTPLALVSAMSQTPNCSSSATSVVFPQEAHAASVSVSKIGRPFVHIKVPQTIPEQRTSMHHTPQAIKGQTAATTETASLHLLHALQNAAYSAADAQLVEDTYSVQADASSQQRTQQPLLSRPSAGTGKISTQPKTSLPAVSGSSFRSSIAKAPNVTTSSENNLNDLPQQVGLFHMVAPPQTEASQMTSQASQMLSVYPQSTSLQLQPLSLSASTNAQNIQLQLVSPLIIGQSNLMIPLSQPGTMSFILHKPATDSVQDGQSFLQASPLTSSSSISHRDFVISHVSPMQNFPAPAQSLSYSSESLRNKCLSTCPSQSECSLTFSNNTCTVQCSKPDNSSASSNSEVKENTEAAIQNLRTHLSHFSELAEPHDIASEYPTNRNCMPQDESSSSHTTTAAVVHFQGNQTYGQEGELLRQVGNIDRYFPSQFLNPAAGNSWLIAPSVCTSSSFVFDALAESPVKDSLPSGSLHPVPTVTSSLLCEMLMSAAVPSLSSTLSLVTSTTSQAPVYTMNSHSSGGRKPSLLSSVKLSPSASAYCQSINFSTHTTPSALSTQPVVRVSKAEQTSLPIAVTIGHNASLSHSQISVSRLNRQRDPPQVGIVHPHVSGGKASLGDTVNSHACSSASNLGQNSLYSSSAPMTSVAAANILGESHSSVSSSSFISVNNSNVQTGASVQELSAHILHNQPHPQQQHLLMSLLLNSQNASLPNKTLITMPQANQFNLSALLGNPGSSVTNTITTSDGHKQQMNGGSQNQMNTRDFHASPHIVPNLSLQNTVTDNVNFLQTPLSLGSIMPASTGNQNTVSVNAGTQLPVYDPHMLYSNTGHVKLVPVILSDGSYSGSAASLFAQNGQLLLNMSPCAGLGSVSSMSPQNVNRDSAILLNLSPNSSQNIQLQHPPLQVEDVAQTSSAPPLTSPSTPNIHHSRETSLFSKDQSQAVQVSVLPFENQPADSQFFTQIEFQRDSDLTQSMSSAKDVENKMSIYTLASSLRPAVETVPAQLTHSDLSQNQSMLPTTNTAQNVQGQDNQSSENHSGQKVLMSCNPVKATSSGETPHKIAEVARSIATSLPASCLTETKRSGLTSIVLSEQHNPLRETRNTSQVSLLNQNRNEDQQYQLQSQQLQLPLQVVSVVQTQATDQTDSDKFMAPNVGTSFVLGQPAFQNFGLGQQLQSVVNMSNPNQIFLPIQPVPFSSHSGPQENISKINQELHLGQQLSELHKPTTVKSDDAGPLVSATQATKNVSTHITSTSMQSSVASSGSHLANIVASGPSSSKHRPIRPKLHPVPMPASKISLMLVPDKPGYPAYQLTQVGSASLPFQPVPEQSNQSQPVSQQPQNVVLNPVTPLQNQNSLSIAGTSKQHIQTKPAANAAFVTQLQLNQQPSVPAQILLLSQTELAERSQNSETQAIIGQNEILTLPSEQMNPSIHALPLRGKGCITTSQSQDIPEMISRQNVSIQPGSFQITSDCDTSSLPFLQNETLKFSSSECESFELRPFENKEYRTGIFSNESMFVNTSQGTFSSDVLRSDTFEVSSLQNSGFDSCSQQTHTMQFDCVEANTPVCSSSQAAVSQCNSLSLDSSQLIPVQQVAQTDIQRLNPQIASQLSSGDVQRLMHHNLIQVNTAGGLGDLVLTTYNGSQILQISQPGNHHQTLAHLDVKMDSASSSGLGSSVSSFTHTERLPADARTQAAEDNSRSNVAVDVRQMDTSTFSNVQNDEIKMLPGLHFSTAVTCNHPVASSEVPVYTQFPQKLIQPSALMLDVKMSKSEDTKPVLGPIQYLQCKDVIDLTEEDSPPLSPNSISMNKRKTVGFVPILSNQVHKYGHLQKQSSENLISGQQPAISLPLKLESLAHHNQAKAGQCLPQQWAQLKQEGKETHGTLHDHVLANLTEGSDFPLCSSSSKEQGPNVLKLEEISEDIRQVLLASLESHAVGNPDVHLVTKAFTPIDDLKAFLSLRDLIHSVTDNVGKTGCPANAVMMSSNQIIERPLPLARTQSQMPSSMAVSDSKLVYTQPENKQLSQTCRSGTSMPGPDLSSLPAATLTGRLKQDSGLPFTVHGSAVSTTSSLASDVTAVVSSSQSSSFVVSTTSSHKLAGASTSCPSLLLATLNTALPRSPIVKAPLRTVIHPVTSSTVAFIRTNTPTEAVGPPNITIMSSAQASTSPHLRLRHENSVSISTAASNPLIIKNFSPKPVSTMAKNHSSRPLKINSIAAVSTLATEQGSLEIKTSQFSSAASEGITKAANQSSRRLSFENSFSVRSQKETATTETSQKPVGSLLKPPEAVIPSRSKSRKKPSTIMDLLKSKEKLQATASALSSASFPVNNTAGPVAFMISGTPDLLLMESSTNQAGINSVNIAVKNMHLLDKLTSDEDTHCVPKQISSSSQPSGFAILQPNILPSVPGNFNIVSTPTHITAITATEQTPSTAAVSGSSVSQGQSQSSVSMTASRPHKSTASAEKAANAAAKGSSFIGSLSLPDIPPDIFAQSSVTLFGQSPASLYRPRDHGLEVPGKGYSTSCEASANSSSAAVQDSDFKHTHLQEVPEAQFQPIGQPQVVCGSLNFRYKSVEDFLNQKPVSESFNGEKLKFKTTTTRSMGNGDRQQELISSKFRLLEDTQTNLPNQNTGTIKKLLLLNEKLTGENSKVHSGSMLRPSIQIADNSQQGSTHEKHLPQKSPQLLHLMKSKQPFSYTDFEPAVNARLSHSFGQDKCAPLKLPSSSVSVTVSSESLVYDYSSSGASAPLSYHHPKENFKQKDQLHVFKTESSVPVLQPKENKMGLLEATGNMTAVEAPADSRINLLPSQHPRLATILFSCDSNSAPLQTLPSETFSKLPAHFENQPNSSGKKSGNTEGNSYIKEHIVPDHQTSPNQLEHPYGSKGERHTQLNLEAQENSVSGLSSLANRAPPAYNHPPRYEIIKKDMTRVSRVIEDIYKFPDEGEEPSPPPVLGSLKGHKFTYMHRWQDKSPGSSSNNSVNLSQSSENTQFSVASNKKSSPKTVQNTGGNSAVSSPSKSNASGNSTQTWRSPKKLKAKREQDRSHCKINLKKVQFSDVVTSKSAHEYGQSATVNSSVDIPPGDVASNRWDKTKCPVHDYSVEDSRNLLGKHQRLEKDRHDNHIVYEKHPYIAEQLETEFREGKLRPHNSGLLETAFTRPEDLQVNMKNTGNTILGVKISQRETDSMLDFEHENQFGRDVHKVFQFQHLASGSYTAAAADGEPKFKRRGEKDISPFQTQRPAHENPCIFQSGFVQESMDAVSSFVNERTEAGRTHSVQNAPKSCEQIVMPDTYEGMSTQCEDVIHNKVDESSRDLTKRRHAVHDENLQFSANPDHEVHSLERNNYMTDKKEFDVASVNCGRDSKFDQQSSFNILSTQGYSKLSRHRLYRTDTNRMWGDNLSPAPFKPQGMSIDETGGTSDHYEDKDFPYQNRCEPVPFGCESSNNVDRQLSESPLTRQKILESNFEIARQMKKGHVRVLEDSRSELSEGRRMESPQTFYLHPDRSEDLSGSQLQRDTESQMNIELEYRTPSVPASNLTSPIFSNTLDGRPDVLTSLESLSCLRKEIKDLKGENIYLKIEVAKAEQKEKEQQRQRKLSSSDKQRAVPTETDKTEKSYYASSSMSGQQYMADTETVTPTRKRHASSTTTLGSLNYSLFPGSEQVKPEESFQSKVCQLPLGTSGIQQMLDTDMSFQDGNHRVSAAETVYVRSNINIDDSPEHYIRDTRDPLVSSSMSSHSRPTSQLDLSMAQYELSRHKYSFSDIKSGPLRSISDGDGFVPLQEHTRHRNLSSSLGFQNLSDIDPPPYDMMQRQRNPSTSSLKSTLQDADILNFDGGARSRNPSSSSWIRYLDYGNDFAINRSRNPSGSSNRRSRPGSSSSSEREHPVNVDELPLFSDIAHTRSRNSSGESIEPTLDLILDPQQFMQYTQYTYQSAEAHSKRTKH